MCNRLLLTLPPDQYDYGLQCNHGQGAIHEVVINGWNRGLRVSCATPYPTGDNGSAMSFGRAVFVKGTDDCPGEWAHHYYIENEHGKNGETLAGNGNGGAFQLLYVGEASGSVDTSK